MRRPSDIGALALRMSVVATVVVISAHALYGGAAEISEALLLLSAALWLARRPIVRASVSAMPTAHRSVLFALLGLLFAGHLADDSRATFPFPVWGMYTKSVKDPTKVESFRVVVIDAQGRSTDLDLLSTYGALSGHVGYAIHRLFRTKRQLDTEDAVERRALQSELIRWIAAEYNARAREHSAREVQVLRLHTVVRPSPGEASQTEKVVGRFEIGGDG